MSQGDSAQVPPLFLEIANACSMGGLIRAMQDGSRMQAMRGRLLAICVFDAGAVFGFPADAQPFHFRYDEVDRFHENAIRKYVNGSYRSTEFTCSFRLSDGRQFKAGGQSTRSKRHIIEEFGELVDPRIAAAQIPRMQAALRQGQPIDFGYYLMEPGGLCVAARFGRGEKRLGWADVQDVSVTGGVVKVMARGRRRAWASVSAPRVPNLTAFITLVRAATSSPNAWTM